MEIYWDSNETMNQIRDCVHHLLERCGYKRVAITSTSLLLCYRMEGTVVQDAYAVIANTPGMC